MVHASEFTETQERSAGTLIKPYRTGVVAVDKTQIAANSSLWNRPDQVGAKSVRVFSHLELVSPATDVDVEVWVRRLAAGMLVSPTSFLKTTNNEGAYTSYETEVTDRDAATFASLNALNTLASQNAVFVGYSQPFVGVSLELDSNVNSIVSTGAWHYETADKTYKAFTGVQGTTRNGAGATLNHDGEVQWTLPTDWVQTTKNGVTAYWARLTVSAQLSATVHVTECGVLLDYCYVGMVDVPNLFKSGKFTHDFDVAGDDVAVVYRAVNGGGSALLDFNLGWH
jgi:hypothetical protein